MKISSISSFSPVKYNAVNTFGKSLPDEVRVNSAARNGEQLVLKGKALEYFDYQDVSDGKVGTKFIITPKNSVLKDLKMLITPDTKILGNNLLIEIDKNDYMPSFKGRLYGSISKNSAENVDYRMQDEYVRFWTEGMYNKIAKQKPEYIINDDYNFFIPSDGKGTRYNDITTLQGGVSKPASYIPAKLNGKQMSLVQNVIANFAKTSKLTEMFEFVRVAPSKGSAYAFLEGLKSGQISTDKPMVLSWGDNFSDINISRLLKNYEESGSGFTVSVLPVDKERIKSLSIIKPKSTEKKTISVFQEKPNDDAFIESCGIVIDGKKQYLASVGPYIMSPQALKWIKTNYEKNPQIFLNSKQEYDFSAGVISNILNAFNKGKIRTYYDKPLTMHYDNILKSETWSDLGTQKDFSSVMHSISEKNSKTFINLPEEVRNSIIENVDKKGNITFNEKSRALFNHLVTKLDLEATNVIAYCKDDNLHL